MVYIPPDEVIKGGGKFRSDSKLTAFLVGARADKAKADQEAREEQAAIDEALQLAKVQAAQEAAKFDGGGLLDSLKDVGSGALELADLGRSALVATGHQAGLGLRNILRGEDNTIGPEQWLGEVQDHIGAGDVIEEAFPDAPHAVKVAAGGALDVAADPLNALTFGAGAGARATTSVIGRNLGAPVAKQVIREGPEAVSRGLAEVAVRKRLADAVAAGDILPADATESMVQRLLDAGVRGGAADVREVLKASIPAGTRRSADDIVDRKFKELARRGKGGIGFGGRSFGTGQETVDKLVKGLRGTQLIDSTGKGFSVTAGIDDAYEAQAVDAAIHSMGAVQREVRRQSEKADPLFRAMGGSGFDPGKLSREMGEAAAARDLRELAPRVVSDTAGPGLKEIGSTGTFVPDYLAGPIERAFSTETGDVLKIIDGGLNWLKRYTTLGPLNAVPHVGRNMVSNHFFAAMFGGVTDPRYFGEARVTRNALAKVIGRGEPVTYDTLVDEFAGATKNKLHTLGLTPEQRAHRALAIHEQGLVGRGAHLFDDVGGEAEARKALLGTRKASQVNEWHEELSRGAVFLKGLDEGLDPRMASLKSRKAMLDYSQEGLTPFERKVMQRIVFFYKFPRRVLPAALRFTVDTPGLALSASKAGAGVAMGARNEYGDPLGLTIDTPLEAAFGTGRDLATDPSTFLNPIIKAAGTGEWSPDKLIPALGQAGRRLDDPSGIFGSSWIPGTRRGKDYATERAATEFQEALADRKARGQDPTATDKLRLLAIDAKIPRAYEMTAGELAQALIDRGENARKIGLILANKDD